MKKRMVCNRNNIKKGELIFVTMNGSLSQIKIDDILPLSGLFASKSAYALNGIHKNKLKKDIDPNKLYFFHNPTKNVEPELIKIYHCTKIKEEFTFWFNVGCEGGLVNLYNQYSDAQIISATFNGVCIEKDIIRKNTKFFCTENDNTIEYKKNDNEFYIGHETGVGGWWVIGEKDLMNSIKEFNLIEKEVTFDMALNVIRKKVNENDKIRKKCQSKIAMVLMMIHNAGFTVTEDTINVVMKELFNTNIK